MKMSKVKTKTFEIYFCDLKADVQREVLRYFKFRDSLVKNWDAFPCAQITMEIDVKDNE